MPAGAGLVTLPSIHRYITMRTPFSSFYLFLFLLLLGVLMGIIQFGIMTITFQKLGLSPASAFLLLLGSLLGSLINIPLFSIKSVSGPAYVDSILYGLLRGIPVQNVTRTIIAVNVGGCLIPLLFSIYLLFHDQLHLLEIILGVGVVTIVSYIVSRPIPGMGIGMPIFVAPLTAALIAITINMEQSAPLAYISGTMGVLIGADLLRLGDIPKMGAPVASIGGAGTFDGIFITGIVAVLLA